MDIGPFRNKRQPKGGRGETVPESNPETPPDSNDPTGPCPRCGNRSSYEVIGGQSISFNHATRVMHREGGSSPDELDRVSALYCRSCNQGIAVVEEKWVGDYPARQDARTGGNVTWHGIHWWPAPGAADLSDVIPEQLREAFSEAVRSHGAKAPRAAAVMFRRTVEGIVRDLGSEKAVSQLDSNDLPGALAIMTKEGTLDRSLSEWAGEVRALGNVGGHFDPLDDVSLGQAEELAGVVRQLLRYLYEEPARIEGLRASRSSRE